MDIKQGDFINSERLGRCKVLRVLPLGTLEVMARSGRCYRISGLPLASKPSPTAAALLSVLS